MSVDKTVPEVQAESAPSLTSALSPEEQKRVYRESLLKAVVGILIGLTAGALCYLTFGEGTKVVWFLVLLVVAIFAYYAQKRFIFPALKLDKTPIRATEWLGNTFLVIIYCLVFWTILLNIGTPVWIQEPSVSADNSSVDFALDRDSTVSYVLIDEGDIKRKDIDFSSSAPVALKKGPVTKSDGSTGTGFLGQIPIIPEHGKMMYLKASRPAYSFNKDYTKSSIYGPIKVNESKKEES